MRIAFLTFEFPDIRPGGVGSYVFKCAVALAAAGHEPHIFTLQLPEAVGKRLPIGVHVHEVLDIAQRVETGMLPPALAAAAMNANPAAYKLLVGILLCDALRAAHQAQPFDVVEAAECEALALPLLLRPISDLPVVVQIHLGVAANAFGNGIPPEERDDLAEALELAAIVGADAVCAATQSVVDLTRRLCPFERSAAIIPHAFGMSADADTVPALFSGAALFVGRLQRRKGCDVLAKASDIFLKRNPQATVRVAGSDTQTAAGGTSMLAEMIRCVDPSVRDRFIYLGELSQAEVKGEVAACRFQVVPSIVENFANTAIDAMALRRLVIYGGNTGLDEVVGDAGIRVWPLTPALLAETMELAWNDPAMAQQFGERAARRVGKLFDPLVVSRQRVAFYQTVIADHQARSNDRQWQALSGPRIKAVLQAMVLQMNGIVGLENEVPTPGQTLTAKLQELAERLGRPPNIWLFGAGRYTLRLLGERYRWESIGLGLEGIVDEHPRFEGMPTYLGLPVQKPQQLCAAIEGGLQVDAIVLSTDTLHDVFRERTQCFADLNVEILSLGVT